MAVMGTLPSESKMYVWRKGGTWEWGGNRARRGDVGRVRECKFQAAWNPAIKATSLLQSDPNSVPRSPCEPCALNPMAQGKSQHCVWAFLFLARSLQPKVLLAFLRPSMLAGSFCKYPRMPQVSLQLGLHWDPSCRHKPLSSPFCSS